VIESVCYINGSITTAHMYQSPCSSAHHWTYRCRISAWSDLA